MYPPWVADSPAPLNATLFNPALVLESPVPPEDIRDHPMVIADDEESDRWSLLSLESGSDDEGEEIGVLRHRGSRRSPIRVAPLPESPVPMSGTRDRPMMVKESLVPMSGSRDRPRLIVESPQESPGEQTTCESPVPSG